MSRTKKDSELMKAMCERLKYLTQNLLGLEDKVAASKMGYSNATTLWRCWHGKTFPDPEKLFRLAGLQTPCGQSPSLHWVITGEGMPLISERRTSTNIDPRAVLEQKIRVLPIEKVESLISLLAD